VTESYESYEGEPDAVRAGHTAEPSTRESPPSTGDERVDEAVSALAGLEDRPVAEHVGVFGEVHRLLQDTLASVDGE